MSNNYICFELEILLKMIGWGHISDLFPLVKRPQVKYNGLNQRLILYLKKKRTHISMMTARVECRY